jgi:hypothetical protein
MTTLTMKEEKRLEIIQRVYRGELTVVEAGRSYLLPAFARKAESHVQETSISHHNGGPHRAAVFVSVSRPESQV